MPDAVPQPSPYADVNAVLGEILSDAQAMRGALRGHVPLRLAGHRRFLL
jgi:hypothetical protein